MEYIIIEGIDGSGKSTIVHNIVEWLQNEGYKAMCWFEPYCAETHSFLDRTKAMKGTSPEYFDKVKTDLFSMIFSVDRYLMRPELEGWLQHKHIVADRSWISTMVYQNASGREFLDRVSEHVVKPSLIIYLDVAVEEALKRLNTRDGKADYFESEQKLGTAKDNYMELLYELGEELPVYSVDANQPMQEVLDNCIQIIGAHLRDSNDSF